MEHKTLGEWMVETDRSDTALGLELGVSRQAVGHWRKNRRAPTPDVRDRLRDLCGPDVVIPGEEF